MFSFDQIAMIGLFVVMCIVLALIYSADERYRRRMSKKEREEYERKERDENAIW